MKGHIRKTLLLLSAAAGGALLSAALVGERPAKADEVLRVLRESYPHTQFLSVAGTIVPGLFSVRMPRNTALTDAAGQRFIFGGTLVDMGWQSAHPVDIQAEAQEPQGLAEARALPRQQETPAERDASPLRPQTFSYRTSDPATLTVTVFSDVDCPYCMKLEHELVRIPGLHVNIALFPVASLHPDAPRRSAQVWCAHNPAEVYLAAMLDPGSRDEMFAGLPAHCPNPVGDNVRAGHVLGISATPTLFAPNGARLMGYRPAEELRAWIEANQA